MADIVVALYNPKSGRRVDCMGDADIGMHSGRSLSTGLLGWLDTLHAEQEAGSSTEAEGSEA